MRTILALLAIVLNLLVAFMTDGAWKTAGDGLLQSYWNRSVSREDGDRVVQDLSSERLAA